MNIISKNKIQYEFSSEGKLSDKQSHSTLPFSFKHKNKTSHILHCVLMEK